MQVRITFFTLFFLAACSQNGPLVTVPVTADNPNASQKLGEGSTAYNVLGATALTDKIQSGEITPVGDPKATAYLTSISSGALSDDDAADLPVSNSSGSLTIGFSKGLLGETQVFGGILTAVSDTNNTNLGDLKLSDIPPMQVRALVLTAGDKYALSLAGCIQNCSESSSQDVLLSIPVVGVDIQNGLVYVDLAAISSQANLVQQLDPDGSGLKLTTKSTKTVSADYSVSTLVFDVAVTMVPLDPKQGTAETTLTARWYLKLNSAFNSAFSVRPATNGVGFFMTERSTVPVVERHALPFDGDGAQNDNTVHYFIKNVPEDFKPAFAASLDAWNSKFVTLVGRKILSYEFVNATDPRSALLVAGDVRYNILEWDLVNKASYGGLGPSEANQFTGQIFSSNIYIQGPTIIELYTDWYKASQDAQLLKDHGQNLAAEVLLRNTERNLRAQLQWAQDRLPLTLSMGKNLDFKIRSQTKALKDPAMERNDFDPIPQGVSYTDYMTGYFEGMVEHEMGHNLGLRHNFRGNLGTPDGPPVFGQVSDSVMEYLGRGYRYLDTIDSYDLMAIKYGYLGTQPEKLGLYCTDEDKSDPGKPELSAECSEDDATNDPYSFFEARLSRVIDLLTGRGTSADPVWGVDDLKNELTIAVTGIGLYAQTAPKTAAQWTNFFGKPGRPKDGSGVKDYVVSTIKGQICDTTLKGISSTQAQANLQALRAQVLVIVKPMQTFQDSDFSCGF